MNFYECCDLTKKVYLTHSHPFAIIMMQQYKHVRRIITTFRWWSIILYMFKNQKQVCKHRSIEVPFTLAVLFYSDIFNFYIFDFYTLQYFQSTATQPSLNFVSSKFSKNCEKIEVPKNKILLNYHKQYNTTYLHLIPISLDCTYISVTFYF